MTIDAKPPGRPYGASGTPTATAPLPTSPERPERRTEPARYVVAPLAAITAEGLLDASRYPAMLEAQAEIAARWRGCSIWTVEDAGGGWWRVLS